MKKLIAFFLFCSLLSACERNLDPPQPTTTKPAVHQDTIRCKVNGKDWEAIPKNLNGQFISNAVTAELLTGPLLNGYTVLSLKAFQLDVNNHPDDALLFSFWIKDDSNEYIVRGGARYDNTCGTHIIDTNYSRPVIVEYHDRKRGLIKGRYSFTSISDVPVIKEGCKYTIAITDGYFSQ